MNDQRLNLPSLPAASGAGATLIVIVIAIWSAGQFGPENRVPSPAKTDVPHAAPAKSSSVKLSAANSSGSPSVLERLWEPVFDFFAIEKGSHASRLDAFGKFVEQDRTEENRWTVEAIIACIPDPLDATVGYHFDPYLEALQHALSTEGFVLDRHSLPWVEDKRNLQAAHDKDDAPVRLHRSQPGVLLFREETAQRLLMVFLVGDNPFSGIHGDAFQNAVNAITAEAVQELGVVNSLGARKWASSENLSFPVSPDTHRLVSVLGPYF